MSIYWLAEFLKEMENKLPPAEQEYANALIGIVGKYGKLSNGDGNGIWVGYVSGIENDNLSFWYTIRWNLLIPVSIIILFILIWCFYFTYQDEIALR